MSKTYPSWSELIAGGQSYQGRLILGLRINTPRQRNTPKPVVFIESGIHAREWIAPATTRYFINELLTSNDPDITRMRDQFDWRIFPSCNPDGYHYSYNLAPAQQHPLHRLAGSPGEIPRPHRREA
ncbi:Zinc carboxypeptidase A 1 [Papilio machaon]|uniref:Zinc carboxypeptidase A 1 n=1 Tax=Papilio machaon TaxID=76193 RepID=A0A194RSK2_PAPMA|nr:Zinc carboxypeptidase A 1 [Papilio machaon]